MTIFLKNVHTGYKFSQLWPKHEPYLMMFEQTKAIRLTDLALTISPAIALITIWLQIYYLGVESVHTAIAMSLMILSLPAHGYYQLGQQANRRLPIGMQRWFREIEQNILMQGEQDTKKPAFLLNEKPNSRLTFMDLANVLNRLFVS